MYSSGRNGDVDFVMAHKWFNLAVMGGNEEARIYRNEIASEMTQEEKAKALRAARQWVVLN